MQINHLSLAVPDVAATAAFMEQYFGFTCTATKGNNVIAVLEDRHHFVLVLTSLKEDSNATYPADFHFGSILEKESEVTALYEKLLLDGHVVSRPPAKIRNSFAFYFHIPGGIMAEISCNL